MQNFCLGITYANYEQLKKAVIWKFPFMLKGALEENFDQLHHQGCQRNLSESKSN